MTNKELKSKQSSAKLWEILNKEDKGEVRALFAFDSTETDEEVLLKFNIWARYFFPNYFKKKDADFHKKIDRHNLEVYRGKIRSFVNIVFRGGAKTTRTKLFIAYAIGNDLERRRKYIKVLTKDISNSKQFVTDVYNMFVDRAVKHFYPEVFVKTDEKREETMASFTTATGIKVRAGTVGTDQRGQLQEDARPDFIVFDDIETRKTLRSAVETQAINDNMEEARTGLSKDGGAIYLANYLSERGNVHKIVQPANGKVVLIVPIKQSGLPTWPTAYTIEEINDIESNADDFAGEYMCEPSAGHDIFFDRHALSKQIPKDPIRVLADFKMFYTYDPTHRYGAGQDIAGGVGLDSSSNVIIDFSTLPNRVVATFHSNTIKPDVFGDEIKNQVQRYGEPIVAPENNKFDMVIGRLKQIYNNIFFTEDKEIRAGMPPRSKTYGWNTNQMTKPKMLFEFKKAIEDGLLELTDEDLINESKSYTRDDLMDRDEDPRLSTRHFDLLMAGAIAWQMRNHALVKKESTEIYEQPTYEQPGL